MNAKGIPLENLFLYRTSPYFIVKQILTSKIKN